MKLNRRSWLLASGLVMAAPMVRAQSRDKPLIRILLGLPPGGGTDAIARYIANRLSEELGQPVIIESRPGVGGRLAADALMKAAPNGLTYMIAPNATPTFQTLVFGSQLKWNIWRDFAPVAGLVSYPLGMGVSLDTGATNAREFVEWVKAHPKQACFGTPGLGGQTHFLGVQFARAAGIQLPVIPYKGTPPLITDLLGGQVPAAVTLMDDLLQQHRAGKLRVLGIFSDKRSELMPDIPTFAEQGYKVSSGDGWTAMWAPAKTPPAEIARIQQALQKILANPQVKDDLMTRLAVMPHYRNAQEMAKAQRDELATWEPIVKASGFKPE
ncbi:tripartite tricarboxylate transporter substrate-binding protein [Polaromonas sp. C04]|uniref:tripartite tricarboxylate transporter substrate-binding protein n=1 Tax=Polaromonas sp. C04 TaxID=1945857 RepID=UPI0009866B77|nr:tripartite tricarboxylate transporter substrate-binding protein [Polaromonas sp. C04]OOG53237.1 ABC transporter substrate-binding protein [Polaromonas sp. C04]